eukprot:jgi/Psemu1/327992/estExt_fgenesh1_pg.C_9290001
MLNTFRSFRWWNNSTETPGTERGGTGRDGNTINVAMRTGNNNPAVYALRDISPGEELIISYGDYLPADHFVIKYGAVPWSILNPSRMMCNVSLWCDPSFLPATSDRKRIACLAQAGGFPVRELAERRYCALAEVYAPDSDGDDGISPLMYLQGYQDRYTASLRQFLVTAGRARRRGRTGPDSRHGSPPVCFLRASHASCRSCAKRSTTIWGFFCKAPTIPPPATATWSVPRRRKLLPAWERAALLARVAYRETLLQWRHAFCQKAKALALQHKQQGTIDCGVPQPHACLVKGMGCGVCGRTFPRFLCSRCQRVSYCSQEHYRLDWEYHEGDCSGPSS